MLDLITQCEVVKKFSYDDVGEKQAMGNINQRHIHPNSKLETQIKPSKFHWTKKAQNKRTESPLSFTLFQNKEEFIKRITAKEPMKKSVTKRKRVTIVPMQKTKIVGSLFSV